MAIFCHLCVQVGSATKVWGCAAGSRIVQAIEPCVPSRVLRSPGAYTATFECTLHTLLYQAGYVCHAGAIVRQGFSVLSDPGTAMCCLSACSDRCGVAVHPLVDNHNQKPHEPNASRALGDDGNLKQSWSGHRTVPVCWTWLTCRSHQAVTCTHVHLLAGCGLDAAFVMCVCVCETGAYFDHACVLPAV